MQTKVSLARKVSSRKTTILATSGSTGQVTGYNSVANATRALDHFTTAADEVIIQRRTSAYQLGKVPARKIKTKTTKHAEDQSLLKRSSCSRQASTASLVSTKNPSRTNSISKEGSTKKVQALKIVQNISTGINSIAHPASARARQSQGPILHEQKSKAKENCEVHQSGATSHRSQTRSKQTTRSKKKLTKSKSSQKVTITTSASVQKEQRFPSTYRKTSNRPSVEHTTVPTPKSSQQIKIAVPAENKVSKFPSTYRKSSKSTIIDTSTIPTPQSNSRPMSTRHRPSQDNGGMSYREWLKM